MLKLKAPAPGLLPFAVIIDSEDDGTEIEFYETQREATEAGETASECFRGDNVFVVRILLQNHS